jgi:pimeloyl-ACP methyl ester carboxylesterase
MTTWVLLRGLMREKRHWGEFPKQLQVALNVPHVVTLDFPGNGGLHTQTSPTSVAEMAEHCRAQLTQLGCEPPYRLLALSLGAMVAVEWSERHPQDIEGLVLINTSLSQYNPFYQRLRPANYSALIRFLLFGTPAQREALILRLTSTRTRTTSQQGELLDQWLSYAQECPISRSNILRQLRAAVTYRAAPTAPKVQVLLLAGQQDKLVDIECSRTIAKRWGCAIKLHPTAGHDLPLDDGDWVVTQTSNWQQCPHPIS